MRSQRAGGDELRVREEGAEGPGLSGQGLRGLGGLL